LCPCEKEKVTGKSQKTKELYPPSQMQKEKYINQKTFNFKKGWTKFTLGKTLTGLTKETGGRDGENPVLVFCSAK